MRDVGVARRPHRGASATCRAPRPGAMRRLPRACTSCRASSTPRCISASPGSSTRRTSRAGSRAAVLGGVTAVFEMPNTDPQTTTPEALADKVGARAPPHALRLRLLGRRHARERDGRRRAGAPAGRAGIKVFMGSSTGSLLVEDDAGVAAILRRTPPPRRLPFRGRGAAARAHAPARRGRSALASGLALARGGARPARSGSCASRARPARASTCCTSRPREEMAFLRRPQGRRLRRGDAAPPHARRARLLRAPRHLRADEPAGARRAHHRQAIWAGVAQGIVDVLGSDHAPHTREEKEHAYPDTPSGMTGVQTLVPIMLDHVNAGRLTLERFVDLTSAGPQRLFGIARQGPHRGRLRRRPHHRRPEAPRDHHQRAGSPRNAAGRPTTA